MRERLKASAPKTFTPKKRAQSISGTEKVILDLVVKYYFEPAVKDDPWSQGLLAMLPTSKRRKVIRYLIRNADPSQMGQCPVCGGMFLRSRRDQPACPEHANTYRVRKSKEKWREKYYPESGELYKVARIKRKDGQTHAHPTRELPIR